MFDDVFFFLHYQNKSKDKQLCFLRVHQAGFTVLQTSTKHHADFTVEKPSVYEVPLQSSFHFSDHNVQSTHSLSCCAPNFDLFCPPFHLMCPFPSHPHLSPNGIFHQSQRSLCLSVYTHYHSSFESVGNLCRLQLTLLLAGLALVWGPPSLHSCLLCLFSPPHIIFWSVVMFPGSRHSETNVI